MPPRPRLPRLAAACAALALGTAASGAEPARTIARWLLDEGKGDVVSDGADGAANGKVIRARWDEGRGSPALLFEDFSLKNYLRPDVREATRVVIPHADRLNPSGPFTLRAVIYPTRDPIYYGGIFEKGSGYGSSYRLVVLRGLKVRASAGPSHAAVTSAEPLGLGAWHDVEVRYDGRALALHVDGKEQGRLEGSLGPFASREDAVIGERFTGKIDEVVLTSP